MAQATFLERLDLFQPTDYPVSTWLLIGASLQCLLIATVPRNVALFPAVILFSYHLIKAYLQASSRPHNPVAEGIIYDRTTTQFPAADGTLTAPPSSEGITVLVLGASFNHQSGCLCPGADRMGELLTTMWADAEANREKWGYLGNTPAMVAEEDRDGSSGIRNNYGAGKTLLYLSYWKSLAGLQAFAKAAPHMEGFMWWEKGAVTRFPHIGIMHETYEVPAGNWENIYHNCKPFGISKFLFLSSAKLWTYFS